MPEAEKTPPTPASLLCQDCGLCCTGHLFIWAKLRPSELDPAEALGLTVFRADPNQRGFSQPCPLWQGRCAIYTSPQYPHICRAYRCTLLKALQAEEIPLPAALMQARQAKEHMQTLEEHLPQGPGGFRERLVAKIESLPPAPARSPTQQEFFTRAATLLEVYGQVFGVHDLLEAPHKP